MKICIEISYTLRTIALNFIYSLPLEYGGSEFKVNSVSNVNKSAPRLSVLRKSRTKGNNELWTSVMHFLCHFTGVKLDAALYHSVAEYSDAGDRVQTSKRTKEKNCCK